jgi:cytidylate kinase
MASITIVSGCPGSGKTTLAKGLARSASQGLHIPSDLFYDFPTAPIDPTLAESHHQNTVIMRALARAARAFAEGGYHVLLDGIIGPWFMPVLREELLDGPSVSYVVLQVDEAEALRRVRGREGPGVSREVRQMVAAFAELGALRPHAIDTMQLTPEQVLGLTEQGLLDRRFQLGWEQAA